MKLYLVITAVILLAAKLGHCQECGGEWQDFQGSCYLFRNERIGWRLARQRCIDSISDLVIITSQEENNYIQGQVSGTGKYYWIGLHDTSDEGQFVWVDNTYLTATGYANFRNGEPNNAELPGEDCGELSSDTGKWNDETCVDLNGFVCERRLNAPIKCDANNGWHEYNDRCYWWSGVDREKYADAEEVCTQFGGHVVSIGDETEQKFVQNIQAFEGLPFWIGLTDQYSSKGAFQWADPDTSFTFQNWGSNQPDTSFWDSDGANCVQIGLNRVANGNWSTDACSSKHYFLCEKDPGYCPVGWENFNGFCYQAVKVAKTYTDAKHFCENEGAYLLTILSDAESQFIGENLLSFYFNGFFSLWLGVSDYINDDQLLWEHGGAVDGYTNWNPSQPSLVTGQTDCGTIYTGFADSKWDTTFCYGLKAFYCKAPLGATLNPSSPDSKYGSCEVGWNLFKDSCYYFSQDVQVQEDAVKACQAVDANLTSITSPEEQSFITTRMDSIRTNLWIGLNDIVNEGIYVWEDGQLFDNVSSFTNWAPGEPSPGVYEDCVHLESEYWKLGTWNNIRCTNAHKYICKKGKSPDPPTTLPPTPPPGFDECGEGWVLNEDNNRCYFMDPNAAMNYDEARLECRLLGGELGSIHSLAENQFIFDMFLDLIDSSGTSFILFIGLDDQNTEGGFQWADGSAVNFLNWNSGEPNNVGEEDCGEMISSTGKWNDNRCSDYNSFVCMGSEYLQSHYNVTRGFGLRYSYQAYYSPVQAEECGRLCEAETSFICLSFDVDKFYNWCQLYDHTKDDPNYDFFYDEHYDHYTRVFNFPTETPPVVLPDTYGCQSGWTPFGNNCFKQIETPAEYDTQRDNCQLALAGADVVSISDIHINNFVNYFIVSEDQKFQYVYIGLTDENLEGLYEWVDGSEVKFTMWDAAQPNNNPNTRDCTEMNADTGMWSNVECSYANSAVCKVPKYDTGSVVVEPTPDGCPEGYTRYYFSCYRFVEDVPLSWTDARDACRRNGDQLLVISTSFENAYVGAQVGLKLDEGMYWTGLSDIETPGYYQFVDGSVPTYVNWGPGQPNDKTGKCVAMYSGSMSLSGRWTDAPCYTALPYVCEKPSDGATLPPYITPVPTLPSDSGCENEWYGYGSSCFLIRSGLDNTGSHYTADSECQAVGAHLASFSNPAEEQYLVSRYNALFPGDNGGFWFGLTDQNDEGNWYWTDGTPLTYTNWHIGEPNDYDSIEECAVMFFNGHAWNDALCSSYYNYICERPKNFQVDTPAPPVLPECVSDRDWKSGPPYCYYASSPTGDGLNSWDGANNWCMQNGGYLVSVTSSYEAQVLRGLVNPSVASYWIGLRESTTGTFEWTDGQPYSYVNWKTGQPNNQNGEESCVEIDVTTGNKWQDRNCGVAAPFICKRPEGTVEPIPTPSSAPAGGGCPDDWYFHSGRCYYVGGTEASDRFDWQTAKSRCVNALTEAGEIGNLATIHSHEEQVFFSSLLKFLSVDVWIGLSDLAVDGQYMWTDQYAVTYTNWKPGKPDNTDLNDCVEMQNDYDFAGIWSNVRCSNQIGYICQKNSDPEAGNGQVVDFGPCTIPGYTDYRSYGESCFKYVSQLTSYDQARDKCASEGASLATIDDTYDQAFVELTLHINDGNDVWIGLRDRNPNQDESEFAWEDEWPLHFTNWGYNEPSQNAGDGCVYTSAMNGWNNTLCSELHRSICKITTAEKPPTDKPVEGECMDGWTDSGSACYWYQLEATWVSWAEAEYTCSQAGGNLASVHSKAENEFIRDFVGSIGNFGVSVWIGLRRNSQGGYEWTDGSATGYTHWNNEEPSEAYRGNPEDCVEMYTDQYGKWNDVDCHARANYVCKMYKGGIQEPSVTPAPPVTAEPISAGLSSGAIAGIVIASVIACILIFLTIFMVMTRSRSTPPPASTTQDMPSGFDNMVYKSYDKPTVSDA